MKNGARANQRVRTRAAARKGGAPQAPRSLLILHLAADKLRSDGLHPGDLAEFSGALSAIAFDAPVVIESTTSTGQLHETLAGHVSAKRTLERPEDPGVERVVARTIRNVRDRGEELSVERRARSLGAEVIETSDRFWRAAALVPNRPKLVRFAGAARLDDIAG